VFGDEPGRCLCHLALHDDNGRDARPQQVDGKAAGRVAVPVAAGAHVEVDEA
jgi:hypothetical protein